jgi:hypothetical protein
VEVSGEVEAQAMVMAETNEAAAASEFAELERLWQGFGERTDARIELIDGEIVVSPTPSVRHSAVVYELTDALFDLTRRNGWIIHTWLTAHIQPTRERLIPDLMVAPQRLASEGWPVARRRKYLVAGANTEEDAEVLAQEVQGYAGAHARVTIKKAVLGWGPAPDVGFPAS